MIILSYGGGVNSTAIAVEYVNRGLPIDLLTFADTGGERKETYKFLAMFSSWLVDRGYPEIQVVKGQQPQQIKDGTLEQECLRLGVLPSRVYGGGSCSMKWKKEPQDRYIRTLPEVQKIWESGEKPTKLIGYDAGEPHRANRDAFRMDKKFSYKFPLIEWDWSRDECLDAIRKAGLPNPGKSSCFYCPSMKKHEIRSLAITDPDLMSRALAMEENAQAKLKDISGLGRSWSWKNLLATQDMFDQDYIDIVDQACGCYDGGDD